MGVLAQVLARLSALGLRFERQDARLATRMAFGMFDTDASFKCAGRCTQHLLAHPVPGCAMLQSAPACQYLTVHAPGVQGGPLCGRQPDQGDGDRALPGALIALKTSCTLHICNCLLEQPLESACAKAAMLAWQLAQLHCTARVTEGSSSGKYIERHVRARQPDVFFVLRVMQLLRGLAGGMGVNDFSSARQWRPIAERALRRAHYHAD